jgi:hypothetical protein
MLLHGFLDRLTGKNKEAWKEGRIRGTVVLVKKEVLGFSHFHASLLDGVHQILGREQGLAFRLVSATAGDPGEPPSPSSSSLLLVNARSVAWRGGGPAGTKRRAARFRSQPTRALSRFLPLPAVAFAFRERVQEPPPPRGPRTRPTYQVCRFEFG